MQLAFISFFFCLFSLDWLEAALRLLPNYMSLYPELYGCGFAIAILVILGLRRRLDIDAVTATLLCFFAVSVIGSAAINSLSSSVLISGLRIHVKFLPFFLLPMAFMFSAKQIKQQLLVLLALTLTQVPVAIYQRFIVYAGSRSGDGVGGTLGAHTSGVLSVWIACTMAMLVSANMNGLLTRKTTVVLVLTLAIPMMINETKISFFLIPFAILTPVMFAPANKGKIKQMLLALVITVGIVSALVPVYDSFRPGGTTIVEWFTSDDAQSYVYGGKTTGGDRGDVKRLDAVSLGYRNLNRENALLFGLGIGNVSPAFSRQFEGEYFRRYENFSPTRVHLSTAVWETGIVGALLFIILIANNLRISLQNLKDETAIERTLALAWICVTGIVLITLVYFRMYSINLINCIFWFYSGHLVATHCRQRQYSQEQLAERSKVVSLGQIPAG